jgi:hypothetical protein
VGRSNPDPHVINPALLSTRTRPSARSSVPSGAVSFLALSLSATASHACNAPEPSLSLYDVGFSSTPPRPAPLYNGSRAHADRRAVFVICDAPFHRPKSFLVHPDPISSRPGVLRRFFISSGIKVSGRTNQARARPRMDSASFLLLCAFR